jgi:short-subunit dehydrogenase
MNALEKTAHRSALVTGASDGIGRATALALADDGYDVVLVARREAALDDVANAIRARGRAARVIVADLAEDDGVAAVINSEDAADVDVVVLAAGFGGSGAFLDGAVDADLSMLDVNCRAVLALSHHFGRRLAARPATTTKGPRALVLYSSLLAFQGVPGSATYAATKAFVQSFAEGLGRELAPAGVDVISVAPGPVHTGFADRAGMKMGSASTPDVVAKATVARIRHGAGARTIRPGFLAKFLELSLSTLPRVARVRILELVMAGMRPSPAPIKTVGA